MLDMVEILYFISYRLYFPLRIDRMIWPIYV